MIRPQAFLIGLVLAEAASAAWWAISHRLPALPSRFEDDSGPDRPMRILVIGESSALGEPYQDWVSIGRILAWQLGQVFPGKAVEVETQARGGASLEVIFPSIRQVTHRPDIVLVYSGHNEFQAHFSWDRTVPYYWDEGREPLPLAALRLAARASFLGRMVRQAIETQGLDAAPGPKAARRLVDVPCCTREEAEDRLVQYRIRLAAIADWCRAIGATPILVVPAGNEGGFEPNRSVLPPGTTKAGRDALALAMNAIRDAEASRPVVAIASYRALLARHPGFAEAHFRLARLLEKSGSFGDARVHYASARDLDAMPQRCRSSFQQAVRRVGSDRGAIVVDGPRLFSEAAAHGLLDDHLFHDAHHPTLRGYTILARDALRQLKERRSLGWPPSAPAPGLDPSEVARHFHIGPKEWAEVLRRCATWYNGELYLRYEPAERLAKCLRTRWAADRILAGEAPEDVGVAGLSP